MELVALLSGGRGAIGAGAWILPRVAGRLFGVDAERNPQLPFVVRLFAVRDLALAAGLALSGRGGRRAWLQMGILSDGADALAALLAARAGMLSTPATMAVSASALGGVGLGAAALQSTAR
ncbi:MAG: hypothetical protein JO168_16040 [Solirubrobacterales bacterium]|nr:hypothetical protein [Solirubrobacterales bacterium]MBV9717568.1 hypothetical protein [Solirubrobacterales bacterium]